jgi:hypothetical protein
MEPLDDQELNQLLRKWEAPKAPSSLRSPLQRPRQSPWRWLWSGRIHIPVPVGAAIGVIASVLWLQSNKVPATDAPSMKRAVDSIDNAVTRPIEQPIPAAPAPAAAPPSESHNESASLSGFHAVTQLEPKVILVRP